MTESNRDDGDTPWWMRRGSGGIQSPAELDPSEDTVVCPECGTIDWEVQHRPNVIWECNNCDYVWTPPDET